MAQETIKQTAGRNQLGEFAPKFAELNDDVLFGEVWSREEKLSRKLRSIITVSVLSGKGMTDASLAYHLKEAKKNGVTQEEMAELLTHIAFYAGWPNAWAAFHLAMEVYENGDAEHGGLFGRAGAQLCRWRRLVSGRRKRGAEPQGRRYRGNPRKCETLAWGKEGELVQPSGF